MVRRIGLIAALGCCFGALAAPSGAAGATRLGETFAPESCSEETYIQTVDPGGRYTIPFDGVITRWSIQTDATPPPVARFKVARVAPGADLTMNTDLTITGQSALETLTPDSLNTFGTQIPVTAGDKIGEYVDDECSRADPNYTDHYCCEDVPVGTEELFTVENFQQNISAVVEKDCDHDGLGDETQDVDLAACAPVTPTKKKKCKKHKKKHRSAESAKKKKCKKKKKHR